MSKMKRHEKISQHDHFRIVKVGFEQASGQKRDYRAEAGQHNPAVRKVTVGI